MMAGIIRLNITDEEGTLLGQVELTEDEIRDACRTTHAAGALAWEIRTEAGIL